MAQKKLSCEQIDYLLRIRYNDFYSGLCDDGLNYFSDGFVITKENVHKLLKKIFSVYEEGIGHCDEENDILQICEDYCYGPSDELKILYRDYMFNNESCNVIEDFVSDVSCMSDVFEIAKEYENASIKLKQNYDRFIMLLTNWLKTIDLAKLNKDIKEMKNDYKDEIEEEKQNRLFEEQQREQKERELLQNLVKKHGKDKIKKMIASVK